METKQERGITEYEKRRVVFDIEANGLKPDKIWCIVCKDIDTDEKFIFKSKTPFSGHKDFAEDFKKFTNEVETWIGHNILGYDIYWVNKLIGTDIHFKDCEDTLVMSRLFRPVMPFKEQIRKLKGDSRLGGHSLDAWGQRLGYAKIGFNDFSRFTEEMLEYCINDVELNHKVYDKLLLEQKGFSYKSIRLEHKVAWLLAQQERNGFYLDQDAAKNLLDTCTKLVDEMEVELRKLFPPEPKFIREYKVKPLKDGSIGKVAKRIINAYTFDPDKKIKKIDDSTYHLFIMQEFNPKSSQQKGERLLSIGWEPKKFTPKGNPATDKDTLDEALKELMQENPEMDALKYLADYNIVSDRQQKSAKWLELVEEDGRVHGRINPIGAGTHRCSHFADNMANIASVSFGSDGNPIKGISGGFGYESRSCWAAPDDAHVIVGADASGIQLRALAHYMNDPEYTKNLLEGDIHTVHQHAAGIKDRPTAKTFIYAWLLGAGDEKVGGIVGVSEDEYDELMEYGQSKQVWGRDLISYITASLRNKGRKATKKLVMTILKGAKVKEQFLNRTPALKRLKEEVIPKATSEGYLIGLDGRKLWIPNEHLAMSMYLQGFEAVIMKAAMCFYHTELEKKKIPFKQVAFVHDEFQIETLKQCAEEVGEAVVTSIIKAGEVFNTNCPLDGEYKVGRNWAETH